MKLSDLFKKGASKPTSTQLSVEGSIGVDTTNEVVYFRGATDVFGTVSTSDVDQDIDGIKKFLKTPQAPDLPTSDGDAEDVRNAKILNQKDIDKKIATAVTSGMTYKGAYDASANTPNLDSSPATDSISIGDTYSVTVAGTFFSETMHIGDVIIANKDNPTTLTDFTRVQRNFHETAAEITVSAVGELTSSTAQDALEELQGDIDKINGNDTANGSFAKADKAITDILDVVNGDDNTDNSFRKADKEIDAKITILNGDDSVDGSVDKKIKDAAASPTPNANAQQISSIPVVAPTTTPTEGQTLTYNATTDKFEVKDIDMSLGSW